MPAEPRLKRLKRFPRHLHDLIWTHVGTFLEHPRLGREEARAVSAVLQEALGVQINVASEHYLGLWLFRADRWYVAAVLRETAQRVVGELVAVYREPPEAPFSPDRPPMPEAVRRLLAYLEDLASMACASIRYARDEGAPADPAQLADRAIDHTRFITQTSAFAYLSSE